MFKGFINFVTANKGKIALGIGAAIGLTAGALALGSKSEMIEVSPVPSGEDNVIEVDFETKEETPEE